MAAHPCVVLYGNSVFLAGILADLKEHTQLELVTVEAERPDAADVVCARRPAAVLFDLSAAQPDFVVSVLRERPGMLLVGVDPTSDDVLVLSGQPARAMTIADLIQVIMGSGVEHSPTRPSER